MGPIHFIKFLLSGLWA